MDRATITDIVNKSKHSSLSVLSEVTLRAIQQSSIDISEFISHAYDTAPDLVAGLIEAIGMLTELSDILLQSSNVSSYICSTHAI